MASSALGDELSCSICLNFYKEPVSLRCGHNFCRDCIATVLDTQEGCGVYSCPECREEYVERPNLEKNRKLCNIVESFQSTQLEKTEIFCTYCVNVSVPASKTCLQCETSLCEKHLMAHNKSVDHVLIEPTTSFGDLKCSTHQEILKYYCTQDNVCVCMSCSVAGEHVGHKMEFLNEAYEKKRKELKDAIGKLTHNRQEAEKRIQNLEKHRNQEKAKATDVTGRVTQLFTGIRKHLDDVEKRVLTEVSRQEKISLMVSNLVKDLELQKDKLSKVIDEAVDALVITDQVTFLRKKLRSDDVIIRGDVLHDVREGEGCLHEVMIKQMLQKELLTLSNNLTELNKRQLQAMVKSDIKLDINTAHNFICISQDLSSATFKQTVKKRLALPERFQSTQVLSKQRFSSGRHYWEVNLNGRGFWIVGVATPSIERKLNERRAYIGCNDKSWGVRFEGKLLACHNDIHKAIVPESPVQTLGIYLDYEAGRLTFYKLCDPVRHLHTFTATFTEPLHAAFALANNICITLIH